MCKRRNVLDDSFFGTFRNSLCANGEGLEGRWVVCGIGQTVEVVTDY